ncbi:MAG: LacI family transcriptional regulator [Clostridia bacterium]|nr:LacI family transcriptional regulator [Clostridia bacterium]
MKKKITIRDVAKYAGVSVATVSNVINDINKTSEETKERVLKAIKEIGYQPDFTARCLAKRKSNMIGIMLPLTEKEHFTSILLKDNPFYSEFISGIESIARQRDYDVLITGIEQGQSCRDWVNKRNLDGLIFLGIYPEVLFQEFKSLDVPIVLIDTYEEYTSQFHNIAIDDTLGAKIATSHLIDLGHRNIALATGNIEKSGVNKKRFDGYKSAMEESSLCVKEELIFTGLVSFEGGHNMAKSILESKEDITAVFAVADILAFGMIKALKEFGKSVPEDISIVGFDDLKMCEYLSPGLTTVRQGIFDKGVAAASTLIDDIEFGERKNEGIILPVELVVRESTARNKAT